MACRVIFPSRKNNPPQKGCCNCVSEEGYHFFLPINKTCHTALTSESYSLVRLPLSNPGSSRKETLSGFAMPNARFLYFLITCCKTSLFLSILISNSSPNPPPTADKPFKNLKASRLITYCQWRVQEI